MLQYDIRKYSILTFYQTSLSSLCDRKQDQTAALNLIICFVRGMTPMQSLIALSVRKLVSQV